MHANRRLSRSLSLIIMAAILLAYGVGLSPASANGVVVLTITGGDNQTALTGTTYALPLQVTVTDDGLPVAGAVVQFDAPKHPGEASLTPDSFTATTGADGVAGAAVTANVYEGPVEVSATYDGQTAIFHLANIVQPTLGNPNYYWIESHCAFNDGAAADDPAANRNSRVCYTQATKEDCEQHWFCWWRDTTAQNTLGDQTVDIVPDVYAVYGDFSSGGVDVLLYRSGSAANVVAIIAGSEFLLVGAGGSRADADNAMNAFLSHYPGFANKHLRGIVLTSADPEVSWGVTRWRSIFHQTPAAPMIVSSEYDAALNRTSLVQGEKSVRDTYAYGWEMTTGSDGFLGLGYGKQYYPKVPSFLPPGTSDVYISEELTIHLSTGGSAVPVTLIPILDQIGGLSVWLPDQKILIPCDLFGPFLPPIAPVNERYIPIEDAMLTLDLYRSKEADYLVWQHGMYLDEATGVDAALDVEYDALNSIRTQTLLYTNQHHHVDPSPDMDFEGYPVADYSVDDIVNLVRLPADLANSPYAQPWTADVASIVRAAYHDYAGWFDGDPAHLSTLPAAERAQRFVDLAGGENAMLQAAKQAVTEHTREGAQWALELLGILRQVYPSDDANDIYVQALRMLAWTTPNAPQRNWYLTKAWRAWYGAE